MFGKLLLLFVTVPLIELALLTKLTQLTSLLVTISLVMTTGLVGMSLVRWQGLLAWQQIQKQLTSGQSPTLEIIGGVLILMAGAFLITPGPMTDTVGFCLLIPGLRRRLARAIQSRMVHHATTSFRSGIWITRMSSGSPAEPTQTADDHSEQPQVRVVDPHRGKIAEDRHPPTDS